MAISPPSDIVLDVINAVEPSAVMKAKERLSAIAGSKGASGSSASFSAQTTFAPDFSGSVGQAITKPADPLVKFEGMVLQTFIEALLPKDAENTYGSGLAGDMWKSMLSEKIAGVVAERGGVGIANRVLADFVMNGENKEPLVGAVDIGRIVDESLSADQAKAMIHGEQRKFLDLLSGWNVDKTEQGAKHEYG